MGFIKAHFSCFLFEFSLLINAHFKCFWGEKQTHRYTNSIRIRSIQYYSFKTRRGKFWSMKWVWQLISLIKSDWLWIYTHLIGNMRSTNVEKAHRIKSISFNFNEPETGPKYQQLLFSVRLIWNHYYTILCHSCRNSLPKIFVVCIRKISFHQLMNSSNETLRNFALFRFLFLHVINQKRKKGIEYSKWGNQVKRQMRNGNWRKKHGVRNLLFPFHGKAR